MGNKQTWAAEMENRGLRVLGETAVGVFQDLPVRVVFVNFQITICFTLEKDQPKAVRKELAQTLRPFKAGVQAIGNQLNIVLGIRKDDYTVFDEVMDATTAVFMQNDVRFPQSCAVCGLDGCDSFGFYKGAYGPVHRDCVLAKSDVQRDHAQAGLEGNIFTGILGALGGALIGGIPSILTILFMSKIFSLLYALIPLAAYKGYELCRGKMTKVVVPIVIVSSIIGGVLVDYLSLITAVMAEGYSFQFALMVSQQPSVASSMRADMLTSLLFVGLGIFIVFRNITRTGYHTLNEVNVVEDTLIPINRMAGRPGEE